MTPVTPSVAANVTCFKSAEIALIRLNLGDASLFILTMMISFTFKDPNVFPAHVSILLLAILTSSPSPRFGINFGCNTKSPLKLTLDKNVFSCDTDFTSSRPNFSTDVIALVNDLSYLFTSYKCSCNLF